MKKFPLIVSSLLLISTFQIKANQPFEVTSWPMFQANAQHTGFIDTSVDPKNFQFAWEAYVGDQADSGLNYTISQVITQGPLAFVSRNNYVYSNTLQAFATVDGKEIWKQSYGDIEVTPPSADNDHVFMQATDYGSGVGSGLRLLQPISGNQTVAIPFNASIWHYFLSAPIFNDIVYLDNGGGMYAYDIAKAKTLWKAYPLPQYVLWTPAVNNKYVVTYADGSLDVFDRNTGTQIETIKDPHYFFGDGTDTVDRAPVLINENKAIGIEGGYLTIYNLATGKIDAALGPNFSDQPAADNQFIYANQKGSLDVISQSNNTVLWHWTPPNNESLINQFAITKEDVFVSTTRSVYAISKTTHQIDWKYPAAGKLSLGMGYLFIMQHSGELIALRTK